MERSLEVKFRISCKRLITRLYVIKKKNEKTNNYISKTVFICVNFALLSLIGCIFSSVSYPYTKVLTMSNISCMCLGFLIFKRPSFSPPSFRNNSKNLKSKNQLFKMVTIIKFIIRILITNLKLL